MIDTFEMENNFEVLLMVDELGMNPPVSYPLVPPELIQGVTTYTYDNGCYEFTLRVRQSQGVVPLEALFEAWNNNTPIHLMIDYLDPSKAGDKTLRLTSEATIIQVQLANLNKMTVLNPMLHTVVLQGTRPNLLPQTTMQNG